MRIELSTSLVPDEVYESLVSIGAPQQLNNSKLEEILHLDLIHFRLEQACSFS